MARPKQTPEEKALIYQTKFKNALSEIAMKDAEIARLTAKIESLTADLNREYSEHIADIQANRAIIQEATNMIRAGREPAAVVETARGRHPRRLWQTRRRRPGKQ